MIVKRTMYETSDARTFDTEKAAKEHEAKLRLEVIFKNLTRYEADVDMAEEVTRVLLIWTDEVLEILQGLITYPTDEAE